jgi:hypothetical protein
MDFEAKLKELTPKKRKILDLFLGGESDNAIVELVQIRDFTVRRHITEICAFFDLKNREGEHFGHRTELVELFLQYKPEMVSKKREEASGVSRLEAPDTPGRPIKAGLETYYIKRTREDRCHEDILFPGALIRIRSPQQMGKTSLLNRLLKTTDENGYYAMLYSLRSELNHSQLEDSCEGFTTLARSFFSTLADKLSITITNFPLNLNKVECTEILEEILRKIDAPIVIAIDEADILFEYPVVARDFFELLRVWHDSYAKEADLWAKLRLIIVHSTDNYILLDSNKSPFDNVGSFIALQPFSEAECQKLVNRYHLSLTAENILQLAHLVGGHPFLMQKALYTLYRDKIPFEQLLQQSFSIAGIFSNHLKELLHKLKLNPTLADNLRKVIESEGRAKIPLDSAFKLGGLGLVKTQNNQVVISSELYRQFFTEWLEDILKNGR